MSPAPANVTRFASFIVLSTLLLSGCPKKQWSYTPPPAPAPSKDFDIHFDATQLDPNGSPRNVDWQPQLQGRIPDPNACNSGQPYSPACTQDKPFQDQPDGLHEAFCFLGKAFSGGEVQPFFGHADWTVAQYNGSIGWFNFGDDWDYDLLLVPGTLPQGTNNEHGITKNNNYVGNSTANPQYIEMEFDSEETDAAFTEGWWQQFQTLGHANDDATALANLFHPGSDTLACGSAVGLFGLDCDHGCRSELHPIYGLAIQRKEDPSDNQWSVMIRNWGTGGYCSQYNDELAENSLSMVLPYTSSQAPTKVEVSHFVSTAGIQCPKVYFHDGQTILNLTMPPPESKGIAAFSLTLQWPAGAQPASCSQVKHADVVAAREREMLREVAPSTTEAPSTGMRGEDYLGALLKGANNGQRPNFERDILPQIPPQQNQVRTQFLAQMAATRQTQSCNNIQVIPGRPPQPVPTPSHKLQVDAVKRARDDNFRSVICHQYSQRHLTPPADTTQQDLDNACRGVQ
jgi:hypothetical protein